MPTDTETGIGPVDKIARVLRIVGYGGGLFVMSLLVAGYSVIGWVNDYSQTEATGDWRVQGLINASFIARLETIEVSIKSQSRASIEAMRAMRLESRAEIKAHAGEGSHDEVGKRLAELSAKISEQVAANAGRLNRIEDRIDKILPR